MAEGLWQYNTQYYVLHRLDTDSHTNAIEGATTNYVTERERLAFVL